MPSMLKDSGPNRVLIRTVILAFQSIGPLCLSYSVYNALRRYPRSPLNTAWRKYLAAEGFFFLFFIWYARRLQRAAVHPPMHDRKTREHLSDKVRGEIHDAEKFLTGWFRGANIQDIGRDELKRFVNWSFWDGRAVEGKDNEEIEDYVKKLETMLPTPFREGRGKAKSLRLTIDPIIVESRSLFWYSIIMAVDTLTFVLLAKTGLRYYGNTNSTLAVFPPRPAAYVWRHQKSESPQLSYWLRPHTSKTRLPIVHLHGIGIGLLSYAAFLKELDQALRSNLEPDEQVGVLVVEVLQISSRLTTSIPTRDTFLSELTKVLDSHGWDQFVLSSHSYGSILSTHILSDSKLSARVSAALLVDPVSILLHMPDVAYNFTVRPPVRANEWILWYFASKDPGVAYTLGRHFFWYENILWRDRIMHLIENQKMRFTVSLASDDLIVDTHAVGAYLTENQLPDPVLVEDETGHNRMALQSSAQEQSWKTTAWKGEGLDILWWQDHDHAEVFDQASGRGQLIDVLVKYSEGS